MARQEFDLEQRLLESFDGSNPFQIRVPQTMWVVSYCDPGLLHA